MKKYVALLRGINVGGNKKVEMSKLKQVFENLKFSNVSTYINSGNVIFSTDRADLVSMTTEVENAIEEKFGFKAPTLLVDSKIIKNICEKVPENIVNDDSMRTDVLFLWDKFDKKGTVDLIKANQDVDSLTYFRGAIVWTLLRKNLNKSGMKKFIGTEVYKHMTARNINTVRKLGVAL
jgi:uncharacterized protein (DUF1697 family)